MSTVEEKLEALTARVQMLEDQEKIRETIARYGFNADLGISDKYVENFAPDAVYELSLGGTGDIVGHEALREFITDPDGRHKRLVEGRGSQHMGINPVIRVNGDTAWAECYSLVTVRESDASFGIYVAGYNHWDFARVGDAWKITRRRRATIGEVHRGGSWGGDIMTEFQKEQ